MLAKVNLKSILTYVTRGQDCKIEITKDGDCLVFPVIPGEAFGYRDSILIQEFDAYDYQDCDNEENYIDWLIDCFQGVELKAINGEVIKMEVVK